MKRFCVVVPLFLLASCAPPSVLPRSAPASLLDQARARSHRDQGTHLLIHRGEVRRASAEFAQALELDPSDSVTRQWAAWTSALLGDQDRTFEHLLWVVRSGDPAAELAIWTAYRLFTRREQGRRLAEVLRLVLRDSSTSPLVRARAWHFRGQCLRYLGRFQEAARSFARLGYVRDWMLVGPFDNDQNAGFGTAYPPELGFSDFTGTYPGKLRPVRWRRVEHFDYDGRINLASLLDPSRWSCAYLVSFLHSRSAREVAFRLGAYRGVKLWLNGRELLADDKAHLGALDQYVVAGRLEPGWNRLLVKVCQRTGPWHLRLRVTDLQGRPPEGIATSADFHRTPDRSADTTPLPEPDSFQRHLADLPGDDPGLSQLTEALWSRRSGFYQRAVKQAVALVDRWPNSPLYHMMLARAHFAADHEGRALKAIRAAERLSTGLPDARIERARYEQRHQRYERALQILAPLLEREPVLASVRELQISLLSDRGWTFDAMHLARSFLDAGQADNPWLWEQIGRFHSRLGQADRAIRAYRRSLELRANSERIYDRLIDASLDRGRHGEALRLVRKKGRVFPGLITSALREAEILLSMGEFSGALKVCDRITRAAPQYWYIQKLRGDILHRKGDRAGALAGYHAALELQPDNSTLRDYVDFLEQRRDEVFERYGLEESQVEALLANPPPLAEHPEADAVFLLDDHVTHVFQDGSASHLVRQIYLIRTEKGQRRFNQLRVPSGATFRLETAETVLPDGNRMEATSIRRGVIHFPALEPGALVHLAYRYKSSSSSWMEDHFAMSFDFQGSIPSLRARWVLVLPREKEIQVLRRGDIVQETSEQWNGMNVTIWTARNSPMLHWEDLRPPERVLRAAVYVSTVPSWDVLAHWQNSLISDQFEIDADIRKKTLEITREARSPMEKLRAVYEFVAREVRYLNHDVGIFGKKPNKAINIFENRFGDCKDKATLMIAMLREVGVQAAYAGVRTVDRGPIFWEVPYAQTNHIITYIPAQPGIDSPMFVDGTSRFGNLLHLPERDQGVKALVLDGKSHRIVSTPILPPEASTLECRMQARVDSGGSLAVRAQERWTGWLAYSHRSRLNVEGKRIEELARELGYRFPGGVLGEASFEGLDDLGPAAVARYELKVPGRVRKEGETLRIKLLWPSNLGRSMTPTPERHYDLFLLRRSALDLRSTLTLPDGWNVRTLPDPLRIDHEFIRFERNCQQAGSEVTCSRNLVFRTHLVPRARYQEFREICGRIDQAEAQDIVLGKGP